MKLRRSTRLPDDARAEMPLGRGERVLAFGRTADGTWVAGTRKALVTGRNRIEWADVAHAQWFAEELVLAVDPVPGAGPALRLRLDYPGHLPETVHERVMASIVMSRRLALSGRGAVRLVARRTLGSEELLWQVVPDEGTDLADPFVREHVDAELAAMRAELG